MKTTLLFTLSIVCSTIYFNGNTNHTSGNERFPASLRAPQNIYTCIYSPGDIAPVSGSGTDIHKARSAASKECFERRIDLFEKTKNAFPSTAQGQKIIDSCVNINCK